MCKSSFSPPKFKYILKLFFKPFNRYVLKFDFFYFSKGSRFFAS
ncbi:hypothetical protein HMPREF3180_01712 [Leptotrichia wadei]|uniref:Uncharacterized protein n=1 Tax=Leptotrichia wadei TaxID=157687 RepID=A0A134A2P3_9FUSO|nr:hypothetical protein HMPREF3180_01712 [Leptotrichia wadei]